MMTSQDHDQSAAPSRGPFLIWLILTILLAMAAAAAWWALQNRAPVVVEIQGETPAAAPLTEAQQTEIARLTEIAALRERQLRQSVYAIDPPVCEAPKVLDLDKFTALRGRENDNFTAWRALLDQPTPNAVGPQSRRSSVEGDDAAPSNTTETATPAQNTAVSTTRQLSLPALSERLEETTAIVLGIAPGDEGGLGTGTGFFISPKLFITNDHVIADVDPSQIFVTNKRLGGLRKAKLLKRSTQTTAGDVDFALLEVDGPPAAEWLPLSARNSKLTPVIAAGYPGVSLASDVGFRKLLRGDTTAAPDLNMNRGEIRSVRAFSEITQVVHTADVLKGYSGGPLIDLCGRVVGVNTFIFVDEAQASKLNNAISASDLSTFLAGTGAAIATTDDTCGPP